MIQVGYISWGREGNCDKDRVNFFEGNARVGSSFFVCESSPTSLCITYLPEMGKRSGTVCDDQLIAVENVLTSP